MFNGNHLNLIYEYITERFQTFIRYDIQRNSWMTDHSDRVDIYFQVKGKPTNRKRRSSILNNC